jgi:hypothetical protein
VDRRFNRVRYDADQIVAAFAGRLRGAVDLDAVPSDLLTAVRPRADTRPRSACTDPRIVRVSRGRRLRE